MDERYRERRRRNNEAVRRCRENKRARISQRDEVTGRLQTENLTLRNELEGLSNEVQALRSIIQLTPPASTASQMTPDSTPTHSSPPPPMMMMMMSQHKQHSPEMKRESDIENKYVLRSFHLLHFYYLRTETAHLFHVELPNIVIEPVILVP